MMLPSSMPPSSARRRRDPLSLFGAVLCVGLLLPLLLCVPGVSGVPSSLDCLESVDSTPLSSRPVGLSESALFYATNYAVLGRSVDIRFVGGRKEEGEQAGEVVSLANPHGASNCFVPTSGSELASISWGKSVEVAGSVLAVGAPSKRIRNQSATYSLIDLYTVSPTSTATVSPPVAGEVPPSRNTDWQEKASKSDAGLAAPPVLKAAGNNPATSIDDFAAPWLGVSVSLAADGSELASLYDPITVAVYKTAARSTSGYNAATDAKLTLPSAQLFVPDTVSLRGNTLAVSGVQLLADGSACVPAVAVYTRASSAAAFGASPVVTTLVASNSTSNAIPCQSAPSSSVPLRLSEDGSMLAVSSPALSTVWVGTATSFASSAVYLTSTEDRSFGLSVDWAYTPTLNPVGYTASTNKVFNVLSSRAIFSFFVDNFMAGNAHMNTPSGNVQPSVQFAAIYPNRQQRLRQVTEARLTMPAARLIGFASVSGFSVAIPAPGSAPVAVLPNPSAPAGHQWHADLARFVECPKGFFSDGLGSNPSSSAWVPTAAWQSDPNLPNVTLSTDAWPIRSDSAQMPCAWCPVNTYQPAEGATTCLPCPADGGNSFCPAGTAVIVSDSDLGSPGYESGLGEFEVESISEAFEELVINKLFKPNTPSMITFFVITGVTILLLILYWIPYLPMTVRNVSSWLLDLWGYFNLPDAHSSGGHGHQGPGHGAHASRPKSAKGHGKDEHGAAGHDAHDAHGHDAHGHDGAESDHGHEHGHAEGHAHGGHDLAPATPPSRPGSAPLAPATSVRTCWGDMRSGHLRKIDSHHCLSGFFNVVFVIMCVATLVFAGTFLSHYVPTEPCGEGINNCVAADVQDSTSNVPEAYQKGFTALGLVQANLYVDIIGLTGLNHQATELCSLESLIDLRVVGCSIGDDRQVCNQTNTWTMAEAETYTDPELSTEEFLHPQAPACRVRWNVQLGTIFSVNMVTEFVFPPFLSWSSLRFWYLQSPQHHMGVDGEPVEDDSYEIGRTNYLDNTQRLTDGNGASQAVEAYPPSMTLKQWQYGVQGREVQTSLDLPIVWHRTWWNSVSAAPTNASYASYRMYLSDPSPVTVMRVEQVSNYVLWRHQSVEKLVQPSLAFLTILLGLIGVLHLVKFGLEMTEVGMFCYKATMRYYSLSVKAGKMIHEHGKKGMKQLHKHVKQGIGAIAGTNKPAAAGAGVIAVGSAAGVAAASPSPHSSVQQPSPPGSVHSADSPAVTVHIPREGEEVELASPSLAAGPRRLPAAHEATGEHGAAYD